MTFQELKLSAPVLRAVKEAGYETPSPIQAQAIPPLLAGRDLMGCAQTGTGKTAAFALPLLERLTATPAAKKGAVRALILTPTRELALQIGESFSAYGKYLKIRHTVIFGGVGQGPQVEALRRGVEVLVACPGRLNDLIGQGLVDLSSIEAFVLDEADRMLDMGFVHDVKKIIAKLPKVRQNLMFSATMPTEIEQLAAGILHDPVFVKVDPVSSTVERIRQSLYYVEKGNKKLLLPHLIKTLQPEVENALVFSRTKHGADKIAKDLCKQGIPAAAIHGNKSQGARVAALEGFKARRTRVLVATDIAARGIDINELAYVFNYDLPEVPETYVHRIGRTARAGADGYAVSFCAPEEQEYLAGIEKLNRRRIPVVNGHPWDGAPAPVKAEPPVRGRKPATPKEALPQEPVKAPVQKKKEEPLMEEHEKNQPAEGGRNRRRRGGRRGGEAAAASQTPAAPQQRRNAQPTPAKFDPHFLTAAEPLPVRMPGAVKAEPTKQTAPAPNRRKAAPVQPTAPAKAPAARQESRSTAPAQRVAKPAPAKTPSPAKTPAPAKAPAARPEDRRIRTATSAENPGMTLISRRPPQQKYASFEEYMNAHGGASAPIVAQDDE